MRKAIVSGAGGFVGSAVVKELERQGVSVLSLVHKKSGEDSLSVCYFELEQSEQSAEQIRAWIDQVEKSENPMKSLDNQAEDVVFYHFAWKGASGEERKDEALQRKNAEWTADCVRLAKQVGCKRFVYAGSIMEREYEKLLEENRPLRPGDCYSEAKRLAHHMARQVANEVGLEFACGVITNAYGEGETSPRLVNQTIRKCIKKEIPQFTAGTQMYDFIYITDLAKAFYLIGEKGISGQDYVIGSGEAKALKEFLLEMQMAIEPELTFVFGNVPFAGVSLEKEDYDITLLKEDTGFETTVAFGEGCKKTMEWIRCQEER